MSRSWSRWIEPQEPRFGGFIDSRRQTALHVRGADKLWAFKSTLEMPLVHIASVRADSEVARGWCHGISMPGTDVPGVITAGTFYQDGKRVSVGSTSNVRSD